MTDPYALYRYFDMGNHLLYVGISGDLAVRDKSHISKSSWMQLAARSAIERHKTLEAVKRAEQEAIETEQPLFNKQYNNTPEARERLRAYLEEIGRLDLLDPKVRAALEVERRRAAAPEVKPPPRSRVITPEEQEYWDNWGERYDRWRAEAEGSWWRPWLESGRGADDPDELMAIHCPVYTAAEAETQWHWWRQWDDGSAWPLVYASVVQEWDEADESSLFRYREHWSVHSDHTSCLEIPFREFTPEASAVQDALVDALVVTGRCTAQKGRHRVDLDGFASKNEARVAGAILNELAWGHTRCARECLALLRQPSGLTARPDLPPAA